VIVARTTVQPELVRSPWVLLSVLILFAAGEARAQAGGYSAGPGLEAPAGSATDFDGGVAENPQFTTRVTGFRPSPAFTQDREFTTVRLWVLDPGKFTVEQWWTGSWGAPRAAQGGFHDGQYLQSEFEMGVVPHVQFDLYANLELGQNETGTYVVAQGGHTGLAAEVRVAIGNYWGQIPLNPTIYFELLGQYYNSPRAEVRVLLGDTLFTPKLLGAVNLVFERNIFRDHSSGIDYEVKADLGLNYEVVPGILRLGVEGVVGFDSHGTLDDQGHSLLHPVGQVGPSILLTEPGKRLKLLATVMHGFAEYDAPWTSMVILSTTFGR